MFNISPMEFTDENSRMQTLLQNWSHSLESFHTGCMSTVGVWLVHNVITLLQCCGCLQMECVSVWEVFSFWEQIFCICVYGTQNWIVRILDSNSYMCYQVNKIKKTWWHFCCGFLNSPCFSFKEVIVKYLWTKRGQLHFVLLLSYHLVALECFTFESMDEMLQPPGEFTQIAFQSFRSA